jgi:cation transport protein ChaC
MALPVASRRMRLTAELAALPSVAPGPRTPGAFPENMRPATREELDGFVSQIMEGYRRDDPFLVFAYGSLIWNPDFEFERSFVARAPGWRRSFCLGWDRFFRGCVEKPGLMLALDRGGSCTGIAFELRGDLADNLLRLVTREIRAVPHPFPPRWITIRHEGGNMRALTFVMDRASTAYVPVSDLAEVARVLATACGPAGSMAEYLYNTVLHLEEAGVRDRYLWRLQEMVAQMLEHPQHLRTPAHSAAST